MSASPIDTPPTQALGDPLSYLLAMYDRSARYDLLIQQYELNVFTVLSVLVSADVLLVGVLAFFNLFQPLLWVISATALGVAGIGVSSVYSNRIQHFIHQREHVELVASRTEEKLIPRLFPGASEPERTAMMLSKTLSLQPHTRQGLLLKVTFAAYSVAFALVVVLSALIEYQIAH